MGLLSSPMGKVLGIFHSCYPFKQMRKKTRGKARLLLSFYPGNVKILYIFDFNCIFTDLGSKVEKKNHQAHQTFVQKNVFSANIKRHLPSDPHPQNTEYPAVVLLTANFNNDGLKRPQVNAIPPLGVCRTTAGHAAWGMLDCEQVGSPRVGENTRPLMRNLSLTISSKKRTRFDCANLQMCLFFSRNGQSVLSI